MSRFSSRLDQVRIAAPCTADWEQMIGNNRVRFCGQCSLNVYNLSELTKGEAEEFVASNEGRLCVRYYQRADGSVLTKNCPVGVKAIRRRMSRIAQAVSTAVISFFAGLGISSLSAARVHTPVITMGAVAVSPEILEPREMEPELPTLPMMGKMAIQPLNIQRPKSRRK